MSSCRARPVGRLAAAPARRDRRDSLRARLDLVAEVVRGGFLELWAHKLRSILTLTLLMLGVFTLVVLTSVIDGVVDKVQTGFSGLAWDGTAVLQARDPKTTDDQKRFAMSPGTALRRPPPPHVSSPEGHGVPPPRHEADGRPRRGRDRARLRHRRHARLRRLHEPPRRPRTGPDGRRRPAPEHRRRRRRHARVEALRRRRPRRAGRRHRRRPLADRRRDGPPHDLQRGALLRRQRPDGPSRDLRRADRLRPGS